MNRHFPNRYRHLARLAQAAYESRVSPRANCRFSVALNATAAVCQPAAGNGHELAVLAAACSAMRSSSAQTSAIRPEMTIRPAQSGLMAASDSRTTLSTLRGDSWDIWQLDRWVISAGTLKMGSLLATPIPISGTTGNRAAPDTRCALGKAVWCPRECRIRLIHGASA